MKDLNANKKYGKSQKRLAVKKILENKMLKYVNLSCTHFFRKIHRICTD